MNRAQLYLIAFLCVASSRKFVEAEKVDQAHRDSHHEKDYVQHRFKRYAMGRVPLSYLYNRVDDNDDGYGIEKRYSAIHTNPVASHFRELQGRQSKRLTPVGDDHIPPSQLQAYHNLIQVAGRSGNYDIDGDVDLDMGGMGDYHALPQARGGTELSDQELQTLLALLEEYRLQGKTTPLQNLHSSRAQYFTPGMEVGGPTKRETGKRAISNKGPLVLEQPMSFENSLGGDGYPIFLNQKRSKRVGNPAMTQKSMSATTRIKKETDPAVEAELDKVFADASGTNQEAGNHTPRQSTSIPTTPIASSGQIPPPSGSQKKPKKSIDWSNYFGIDKRQETPKHAIDSPEAKSQPDSMNNKNVKNGQDQQEQEIHKHSSSEDDEKTPVSTTTSSATANTGADRDSKASIEVKEKKLKEKKDTNNKGENDADEKAQADRKWILKEFYKNLAMSTNVKRKRESPAVDPRNDLDKLEKIERKMEEAGDQIIWDALKYTGAHKDAELSPEELGHVKNEIIQKLTAAYSLEKVREAIENFRQQLGQLKDKQQHY